ncbi:MAG: hypothetical protein WCL44_06585 [bacterium]
MTARVNIMGGHPLDRDAHGNFKCRIATIFIRARTIVTAPPMHLLQRNIFIEWLDSERKANGKPPLTAHEKARETANSVDLVMDGPYIQIRPDPSNMPLAFEADLLLQELEGLSKRNIRFLFVYDKTVQQAIRKKGELWRITPIPQSPRDIVNMIESARMGINGLPIYYYSTVTGIRYLTLQQFSGLRDLDTPALRSHLQEICTCSGECNCGDNPEVAFFGVKSGFGRNLFSGADLDSAGSELLRQLHRDAENLFRSAVPADLREDNPRNPVWRNLMFSRLIGQRDDVVSEEILQGLNPEFFMQIQWLPGGRIDHGELMFDPIFAELERNPCDHTLQALCDESVKGFICNYILEFGNLEHVNVGRISPGLRPHIDAGGHRAYIAEVKHRGSPEPVVRIIRFQKWGIREHLDEKMNLLRAIMESEDYTSYTLERRLAAWQLGMSLPSQLMSRRIANTYRGSNPEYQGTRIWTTYFEREYLTGLATERIPQARFKDEGFALAFARLLGRAAAPNMLVGRQTQRGEVIFDNGDEILVTDCNGMPEKIVAADHAGTFHDCESPLAHFAEAYARPVVCRSGWVPDRDAFANAYTDALAERMTEIQQEYRKRRRAFDSLLKHSRQDVGSISWRWKQVLARLDQTHVPDLIGKIREFIRAGDLVNQPTLP